VGIVIYILGLGAGLGAETIDKNVYGEKALERITGIPAIAIIPFFTAEVIVRDNKKMMMYFFAIALLGSVVVLTLFNYFIKPLDVTWFLLMNKIGLG
jgi:polysaccharide biosynthesis transport protein